MSVAPEPEKSATRRSRVARRLLDQRLRTLGIGVTVLVLATTAAFGGLRRAESKDHVRPVTVGETARVAPFDIRIERVVWVDELPNVTPLEDGSRWLAVRAVVRNTDDTATEASELTQSVALTGVDGLVEKPQPGTGRVASTYRKVLADTGDLSPVQPGIDYPMVFLFEQRGSATPPTKVTVQLVGHTWRQDSFDKTWHWLDPAVVASSTLPMAAA